MICEVENCPVCLLEKASRMTLEEFAKNLGVNLTPWQLELAKILERGEALPIPMPRGAGKTFLKKVYAEYKEAVK